MVCNKKIAGGCEVVGIYNASFGLFDVLEAACGLFLGLETSPCFLKRGLCDEFPSKSPNSFVISVDYSQGTINNKNFLESYGSEKSQRIFCIEVAPAAHIEKGMCVSEKNLKRWLDLDAYECESFRFSPNFVLSAQSD